MNGTMDRKASEHIDLTRDGIEQLVRTVVALANGCGGTIVIGEDGACRGVRALDDVSAHVMHTLQAAICPDVMGLVELREDVLEGKSSLSLRVQSGTARPYFLRARGVTPEGVYVREGRAALHATERTIDALIEASGGDRVEAHRSRHQALSFEVASAVLEKAGVSLTEDKKRALGLVGCDGLYTNLALWLSDQCEHTIHVARIGGKKRDIQDRRVVGGSLFAQLAGVSAFIADYNGVRKPIDPRRVDPHDYPDEAVREALLNAIVHRSYGVAGSTLVNLFDDRLEIITLGGLVAPLVTEEILLGVSMARNPQLAKVFSRANLVVDQGIGLRRIFDAYAFHSAAPKLDVTPNAFKITLPNVNYQEPVEIHDVLTTSRVDWMESPVTDPRKLKVLELLKAKGRIVRPDVDELLHISQSASSTLIREMLSAGYIRKAGSGRLVHYVLT